MIAYWSQPAHLLQWSSFRSPNFSLDFILTEQGARFLVYELGEASLRECLKFGTNTKTCKTI
ncbi:MAG: hypothetical protein DRR19_00130 [Candidatus Parabeggiatoa sp. nov. 1]|nr:MAG: hypothetical protein DRR19_00130 [Gammaproteobacteria bacterium]